MAQSDFTAFAAIQLTKGYCALVDIADYEQLNSFNWYAAVRVLKNGDKKIYACRKIYDPRPKTLYMHREIMQVADDVLVDHKDRDGLNNRRYNLRAATHRQNNYNTAPSKNKTGYRGVAFDARRNKWTAFIRIPSGKRMTLGRFNTPEGAAKAYADAVKIYHDPEFSIEPGASPLAP